MPSVRKVVSRSPHRRVGFVACPWFQPTPIEYESLLERDFIRLALLDLEITSIVHQPFLLDLRELGAYTPDFLLNGPSKRIVVEVKPQKYAQEEKTAAKLARAETVLQPDGITFFVATEQFIQGSKRHQRAGVLLRHARGHLAQDQVSGLLAIASDHPNGISIGSLALRAEKPIWMVLHLVGRRKLRLNADLQFDDSQLIFPIGGCDA
jgi:hypothetical protein